MSDPGQWPVRCARERDLATMIDALTGHMDAPRRSKFERKLTRFTRDADKEMLVALDGARAVGFFCVLESDEIPRALPPGIAARLEHYACGSAFEVRPDYRRRGVGASLFTAALEWGKARDRRGLWLITHRTGPWYQRHFGLEELARIEIDGVYKAVMAQAYDTPGSEHA